MTMPKLLFAAIAVASSATSPGPTVNRTTKGN
ncbi:hypothetical protein M2427_001117 [Bradyrhizobium sp. BR13661]|jgi:hypothetical protein|nr:hypothetical protein [Bradyrhizobium sp. BR13661]